MMDDSYEEKPVKKKPGMKNSKVEQMEKAYNAKKNKADSDDSDYDFGSSETASGGDLGFLDEEEKECVAKLQKMPDIGQLKFWMLLACVRKCDCDEEDAR